MEISIQRLVPFFIHPKNNQKFSNPSPAKSHYFNSSGGITIQNGNFHSFFTYSTLMASLRRRAEHLPTGVDLERAARSLTNLLDVYRLEAREVVSGLLASVQTGARLPMEDIYYLAREADRADQPRVAADLLREAIREHLYLERIRFTRSSRE